MNTTNNQLINKVLLASIIGKKLKSIHHDQFLFSSTSYGVIYFNIDNTIYALTDFYEIKPVLGFDEEISVLKFNEHFGELKSYISNENIISEEIKDVINNVTIVNTKTHIINKYDNSKEYTLLDTHGVIITIGDDYQIAFEKDDYGENISVYRGYNLEDKFKSIYDDIISNIIDDYTVTCELTFESL